MGDRYNEIYAFILYSCILGFTFGALYDFFRIIRMAVSVPGILYSREMGRKYKNSFAVNTVVFICDILFFVIAACITAIFIFHANNGNIRGIALFGSLIGFIVYYNTVGRLVTMISGFIIRSVYYTVNFIIKKVILPILFFILHIIKCIWYTVIDVTDLIYTKRCMSRIVSASKKGFLK
ncbi:MAG: hypothetical protein E7652_08000 [Ruminococcaceae bacterium]|nr:hypothetical protein [Oscillospiraceae bacterium]